MLRMPVSPSPRPRERRRDRELDQIQANRRGGRLSELEAKVDLETEGAKEVMPIPYCVNCSVCLNRISVTARAMDPDGDIFIEVAPCETCLDRATEAAREEAHNG